jgi:hypothetical protein
MKRAPFDRPGVRGAAIGGPVEVAFVERMALWFEQ